MSKEFRNNQERLDWLQRLAAKEAMVRKVAAETGKDVSSALNEVDRQRSQIIKDNTITKSGDES